MGMGARMCLSSSTKFPVDSYLYAYVIEGLLEVLKWGAPPRCVLGTRGYGCVCVRVSSYFQVDIYLCVYVCIWLYINTAERLRLHKAVILLLRMESFVLKIVQYSNKY